MKRILLTSAFALFSFANIQAQCPGGATAGDITSPAVTTLESGGAGSDAISVDLSEAAVGYSGTSDYAAVVTFPENEAGFEVIAGVTYDGAFDFSMDPDGEAYADGSYRFTGFGFNQGDLNVITGNIILRNLLNQGLETPCVLEGMNLAEIFACVKDNPLFNTDSTALTIDNVVSVLSGQVADVIGYTPCLTVEENTHQISIGATGLLEEQFAVMNMAAFPNPTTGLLNLEINAKESDQASFVLMNQAGSVVLERELQVQPGSNTEIFDLGQLAAGLYFYQVTVGDATRSERIQVIR